MAEAIIRQHKRRVDRWLPKAEGKRTRAKIQQWAGFAARCIPPYLLAFAEVVGIPSGLHAAYGVALAAAGGDVRPVLMGGTAALLTRLLSGLSPRWEMLLTLLMVAAAPLAVNGQSLLRLTLWTALTMIPTFVCACLMPTAAQMLQGWACVGMAVLSGPVMVRAIRLLPGGKRISALEEQVAVGYLAAMCLCGGARLMVLGVNTGVLLSGVITLGAALSLGAGAAVILGMLAGLALCLQGLPMTIPVAMGLGGFLAGIAGSLSRRRLSCGCFAMGAYLMLLLDGGNAMGCGCAVLTAGILLGLLPRARYEELRRFFRRFVQGEQAPGDAYASIALSAWERTVAAMARSVPAPKDEAGDRSGTWWQEQLCQGCPEAGQCGCMSVELSRERAEAVWAYRHTDEQVWRSSLEMLRGLGCQRLYHLMAAMDALRQEDEAAGRVRRQTQMQRDMLVTHLTAMSGAARRFAALSAGENWWDMMAAKCIRRALSQRAIPAVLIYVRRVQGYAQAAFELQFITGARRQADDLCALASAALEAPMQLASLDGDRVLLAETPLLRAEVGFAAEAADGSQACGDTPWTGMLADGRFLAVLSDGMGHGEQAALASQQTVELLRLCMDAGYTRQQALTAVNGMMFLGGGERFATADVLTIDLWQGDAALDKLGAAASWVYRKGAMLRLTGDVLPLGIVEEIGTGGECFRLEDGDAVVLLTDGVEDAFHGIQDLEEAVTSALACQDARAAAAHLMEAALQAGGGQRSDDQSAVVVYIRACAENQALRSRKNTL
ncbi:MAG: SpoIIE family protein phosphatase [Clostridia bacterium]|nr:SpoIIE family protein phosphatase [Clostridia bacterium]